MRKKRKMMKMQGFFFWQWLVRFIIVYLVICVIKWSETIMWQSCLKKDPRHSIINIALSIAHSWSFALCLILFLKLMLHILETWLVNGWLWLKLWFIVSYNGLPMAPNWIFVSLHQSVKHLFALVCINALIPYCPMRLWGFISLPQHTTLKKLQRISRKRVQWGCFHRGRLIFQPCPTSWLFHSLYQQNCKLFVAVLKKAFPFKSGYTNGLSILIPAYWSHDRN